MNKNDHYAKLNERFEVRSLTLRAMGFRYERIEDYDMACFIRKNPRMPNRIQTIAASFVMCADDICWEDKINEVSN